MMTKEKQIEEMAKDYYEAMLKARGTLGSMNEGAPKWYAKELHNAGYRKASEVARNIFGNLRILGYIDFDGNFCIRKDAFEELENKYIKSEDNG